MLIRLDQVQRGQEASMRGGVCSTAPSGGDGGHRVPVVDRLWDRIAEAAHQERATVLVLLPGAAHRRPVQKSVRRLRPHPWALGSSDVTPPQQPIQPWPIRPHGKVGAEYQRLFGGCEAVCRRSRECLRLWCSESLHLQILWFVPMNLESRRS